MTEREAFETEEQKRRIIALAGGWCMYPGCMKPAIFLAHRIAQTKANIKKYGKAVIHHERNLVPVCEIPAHNDYFNIGNRPLDVSCLVEAIKAEAAHSAELR